MKTKYFIEVYINYKRNWSIRLAERTNTNEIKKVVWLASFVNEELMNCELEFLRFQKLDKVDLMRKDEVELIVEPIKQYEIDEERASRFMNSGWTLFNY